MAASRSSTRPEPHRPQPSDKVAILLAGVGLIFVAGILWWAISGPPSDGVRVEAVSPRDEQARLSYEAYVGDQACRECHPGVSALHSRSGHARTLRLASERALADWLDGQRVADPELPNVTWSYTFEEGQLFVTRTEPGQSDERFPVDYAFGSGHHATTFLTLENDDPREPAAFEHRLTYFAHDEALGVTPGQTLVLGIPPADGTTRSGRHLDTRETLRCFNCHATVTSAEGPSQLDLATLIPNVSCERCHGPGRSHVEDARRGASVEELTMPLGPGQWTADSQLRFCGQCHRHPDTGRRERIRPDNPEIVRFQPVGLIQSKCYTHSDGALSCVTCHDPHARTSTNRPAYESTCLSCHQTRDQVVCSVSPSQNCIGCHMPRRDSGQSILFTDHWIRVHPHLGEPSTHEAPEATAAE